MIKIFRNIRRHLLKENKFTQYLLYAIGEIVLVVIGILIALKINNWNENRKELVIEQKILKELQSDFLYNKNELEKNIAKATLLAYNCDSLLALISSPKQEISLDQFSKYTWKLGGYSTFNPSNGALVNLISSGNLNIIKQDSLRMHLARWSGILEDVKEDEKRLIDFGDNQLDPIRFAYLNRNSETAKIDPEIIKNLKFENCVRRIRGSAYYNIENYEVLNSEISKILSGIDIAINTEY